MTQASKRSEWADLLTPEYLVPVGVFVAVYLANVLILSLLREYSPRKNLAAFNVAGICLLITLIAMYRTMDAGLILILVGLPMSFALFTLEIWLAIIRREKSEAARDTELRWNLKGRR